MAREECLFSKEINIKIGVSSDPAVQNAGSSRVRDRCRNSQPHSPPPPFPSSTEGRGGEERRGCGAADHQRRDFTPLCALHYTALRRAAAEQQRDMTLFPCWWGGSLHQWTGRLEASIKMTWKSFLKREEEEEEKEIKDERERERERSRERDRWMWTFTPK